MNFGKKKSFIIILNEISDPKLILLIDVKTKCGKVAFYIIKQYKIKEHLEYYATFLEMLRGVKFVIDTKTFCLKIRPENKTKNWSLQVFCDSDWAGDSEKIISVTGFIVYLMNVPVCWRSKAQRGVTLSNNEAEYFAISKAVKKIKFIYYLEKLGLRLMCQSR
jgi:hypothetical protein